MRNSLLVDRRKTVDLREELKTVEDYLNLEKVRYEDRLKFTIDADPASLYCQVPPMMLQTLAENGVKHGISKIIQGGTIEIRTSVKNDVLTVVIINSGVLETKESNGIGLKNTAERLSLLYGIDAHVEISQATENQVSVELTIPLISKVAL